jgi:hypothetical protein
MSSFDEYFLNNSGGVTTNSLCANIEQSNLPHDAGEAIKVLKHSAYFDNEPDKDDHVIATLQSNKDNFSVLCSNLDSIYQKHSQIEIFTSLLEAKGCHFSAICLQECRITHNSDTTTIQLPNYTCITQGKISSEKGGLIIYLHTDFDYETLSTIYTPSDIWEGLFIKVRGVGLSKQIILGNIYRPPRDLLSNYKSFFEDFEKILSNFTKDNSETILTGDFNINLLEIPTRQVCSKFFDLMCSNSFYPKITLPTRFTTNRGTLIDNIFCKLSPSSLNSTSGILTGKWSDHQPYFTCLNTITNKKSPSKIH